MGDFGKTSLAHLLTAILTLAGYHFAFRGAQVESEASLAQVDVNRMKGLYDRITGLEAQVQAMSLQINSLQAENQLLRLQSSQAFSVSPRSTLYHFLDAYHAPAWIKRYVPEEDAFRMLFINDAFVRQYGVSKARYQDAKDADVLPSANTFGFEASDRLALKNKSTFAFTGDSDWSPDGIQRRVVKMYFKLPDGTETVAGMQVYPLEMLENP